MTDTPPAPAAVPTPRSDAARLTLGLYDTCVAYKDMAQLERELTSTIAARDAEIAELRESLTEIQGCFDAALCEGLEDRMSELDIEQGSIHDLINRRLMPAHSIAVNALSAKASKP